MKHLLGSCIWLQNSFGVHECFVLCSCGRSQILSPSLFGKHTPVRSPPQDTADAAWWPCLLQKDLLVLPKLLVTADHLSLDFSQSGCCESRQSGLATGPLSWGGHCPPGSLVLATQHEVVWDELAGLPPPLFEDPT